MRGKRNGEHNDLSKQCDYSKATPTQQEWYAITVLLLLIMVTPECVNLMARAIEEQVLSQQPSGQRTTHP